MKIKSFAVIYDDRDPNNKGWYVRAFDAETAEQSHDDEETTDNMPTRRDAWKAALAAGKRAMREARHTVVKGATVRVYYSISRDLPDVVTTA
ncbi:MAG: hypothetical protein E6Q97_39035 [Desulfurellales bacterium]|nr:MAG: hypothetical protein E6Q97_39035 [Desulfurellales bacterium]